MYIGTKKYGKSLNLKYPFKKKPPMNFTSSYLRKI
jgi:hypothetical protein